MAEKMRYNKIIDLLEHGKPVFSTSTVPNGSLDDLTYIADALITSQLPVNRWHEVIGDPTLADAILDRIIHRAHRIDLKGPSLRRRLVASESPAA
jgi:hypothetical protein